MKSFLNGLPWWKKVWIAFAVLFMTGLVTAKTMGVLPPYEYIPPPSEPKVEKQECQTSTTGSAALAYEPIRYPLLI